MEASTVTALKLANLFCVSRFTKISHGKITNSFCYYFRLAFILTVYLAAIVCREFVKSSISSQGAIAIVAEIVDFYGRIPVTIIDVTLLNYHNLKLLKFLKGIVNINEDFKALGFNLQYKLYKKVSRWVIIGLIVKFLLQQVAFATGSLKLSSITNYFVYNLDCIFLNFTTMIWILSVFLLKENFKMLNGILRTLMYRQCWVVDDFVKTERLPVEEILKNCAKLYDKLCMVTKILNEVFAMILLFNIPMIFVEITYNTFSICQMAQGYKRLKVQVILYDFLYLVSFLELTIPCIYVKEEADKFVGRLNKVDLNLESNKELDILMSNLALQIYHQKFVLSAFGVFPMDGTLVYSIFGAITTYLVILLQFDTYPTEE